MDGEQVIRFSIEPRVEQEGDLWTAYCDELGLASCGENLDEALENLRRAITAFCRALGRKGLLEGGNEVSDEIKVSITLEYCGPMHEKPYRVTRAKNTTVPRVDSYLTEEEANGYIAGGVEVTIKPR